MATTVDTNELLQTDVQKLDGPQIEANGSIPRDVIERRAYERFVERGGTHGADVDDWLQAELELLSSRALES